MPDKPRTNNEREIAIRVANEILDTPCNDPDGDMCILSRQFLRAIERNKPRTPEQQLEDAAMLLRLSVRKLKRGDESSRCFADKIVNWLIRNDLRGSILRGE